MRPRLLQILKKLATDPEADLVWDNEHGRLRAYCGDEKIQPRNITDLQRMLAITKQDIGTHCDYFDINDTGRAILRRPELGEEVTAAVYSRRNFTIRDDRVVFMDEPEGTDP